MRRLLILLAAVASAPACAEINGHEVFAPVSGLQALRADPSTGTVLVRLKGRWMRLRSDGTALVFEPHDAPGSTAPADAIPHSRAVAGRNDIRLTWLAGATDRYGHGVLGDAIEAGELKVRTADGRTLRYVLADEHVFEDLIPRLVDVDGDGRDEVLLVRSHRNFGAAVVLLGLRGGRLALVAESRPIGLANRWLNPVGVADFNGDGTNEVAVVETPHIGGQLVLYRLDGRNLREIARHPGYSTHVIGSTVLEMAAIFDVDGDGIADILLPSQDRKSLAGLSLAGGGLREVARIGVDGRIAGAVVLGDVDGRSRPDAVFWDTSGRIHVIFR